MKQAYKEIILSLKLFDGCSKDLIEKYILSQGEIRIFRSGEIMECEKKPSVGILLAGHGVIYSSFKDKRTLLRFIAPGSAVWVASLFATKAPETRIEACGDGKSEMFFIGRNAFEHLLENNSTFRINLIEFLADRVSFLNSKIDTVTAGSAERRLAIFIKNSPVNDSGVIEIGMSMTALAHALDIGRASLYRAFDSLEESGTIKKEKSVIRLISPGKLDEIC